MKKFFVFLLLTYINLAFSCTTIMVSKKASSDNSVMVAQSVDDEVGDQRIISVPAKDHKKGSKRAVWPYRNDYPRYVGNALGKAYNLPNLEKSKPTGYIDEVKHTYAYFDGAYGMINEHQLGIGESTCASRYLMKPSKDRLFDIRALSHIALERCKTAKEAIKVMGQIAEQYGYYGGGETLTVGDTEEAWVFQISETPSGKGAIWVAKKVPDGEVYVCANIFNIREVKPKDPDMLFSSNLFSIAITNKWWDPSKNEKLDWLKIISPGEYDHPYYSLRRVWRIFTKVNPSLNFSPWVKNAFTKDYPFSIKPLKKLSVRDVFSLYRDHYEGTEFDMTKGLASGPYGNPNRNFGPYDHMYNEGGYKEPKLEGAWERSVSVNYCGFTYVNQLRGDLPNDIGGVCWIALDVSYTSCFMPLYIGVTDIPHTLQYQTISEFDETKAWWIFNIVSNWATLKYDYAKKDILQKQIALENMEFEKQSEIEKIALRLHQRSPKKARKYLTDYCMKNTQYIKDQWWKLGKYIIAKYTDGYVNFPKVATEVGYPKWWRDRVGYPDGPTTYDKKIYHKGELVEKSQ